MYLSFKYLGKELTNDIDDLMIITSLLNYNIKDDISNLMNELGIEVSSSDEAVKLAKKDENIIKDTILKKAKFIFENKDSFYKELNSDELSLYQNIELPLSYVLSDMEYTGVSIDTKFLLDMKKEVGDKLKVLEENIYSLAGKEFNILSPSQLGVILFEDLKIPYPKRVKAGQKYKTGADILEKVKDYEIVSKVLDYRTLSKLYANYIVGLLDCVKEDGKIHTTFTQTLTRTGRLSSLSPNLQNIPVREEYGKLIRQAFIPSSGNTIITSDYSQIELRVFAHMSRADNLIEAFNNDLDIHTKTAMDIYHISKDEVTPNQRRDAKAVNFGILYGISSFGLSEDLGISFKEAKDFIDNYLNTYPGIKTYMDNLIKEAYKNGYVKTLFGRKRVIDELKSNVYMIRTAADILKIAMINIYNRFSNEKVKAKMIIQVHDELLIDCPLNELDKVKAIVKDEMENAYKLDVPLKVDISSGHNWYEAK